MTPIHRVAVVRFVEFKANHNCAPAHTDRRPVAMTCSDGGRRSTTVNRAPRSRILKLRCWMPKAWHVTAMDLSPWSGSH